MERKQREKSLTGWDNDGLIRKAKVVCESQSKKRSLFSISYWWAAAQPFWGKNVTVGKTNVITVKIHFPFLLSLSFYCWAQCHRVGLLFGQLGPLPALPTSSPGAKCGRATFCSASSVQELYNHCCVISTASAASSKHSTIQESYVHPSQSHHTRVVTGVGKTQDLPKPAAFWCSRWMPGRMPWST